MKKFEIKNLFEFLSNVKLNKFEKEMRSVLISNYLKMNPIVKDINSFIEDANKKIFEGKETEVELLRNYREEYNLSENKEEIRKKIQEECKEVLDLEYSLIITVNNMYGEEVDLDIQTIDRDEFVSACAESDIDITLSDLNKIEKLFK